MFPLAAGRLDYPHSASKEHSQPFIVPTIVGYAFNFLNPFFPKKRIWKKRRTTNIMEPKENEAILHAVKKIMESSPTETRLIIDATNTFRWSLVWLQNHNLFSWIHKVSFGNYYSSWENRLHRGCASGLIMKGNEMSSSWKKGDGRCCSSCVNKLENMSF